MAWYVVHTYSGHENKVCRALEKAITTYDMADVIKQVLVPAEEVTEMKNGKRTSVTRKFFPGYILVEMEMTKESEYLVTSIPGVTRFVGAGQKPQALRESEVESILRRLNLGREGDRHAVPYQIDDHIKVVDGPFKEFNGVVKDVNVDRGKLKVMVTIFNRSTPVELDFLQVEPV
ncbi:MAG: transcription termination/antitermination protein NusG [Candidatus Cloacimonetes bacterium 4572_55]|nr:MAG: transcription termination/antitermination protein NusG [Candidatus Cloacimonetes bacterium 4572_55]